VNYLRNVALRRANTEHVFLLDIDFLPMPNLYSYSRQLLESAPSIANKLGIATHNKLVCTNIDVAFNIFLFILSATLESQNQCADRDVGGGIAWVARCSSG